MMMHITDNAGNRAPFVFAETHSVADRVRRSPERARHRLVDGHHQRAVLVIRGSEAAPAFYGNARGFAIARSHGTVICLVKYARPLWWSSFYPYQPGVLGAAQSHVRLK